MAQFTIRLAILALLACALGEVFIPGGSIPRNRSLYLESRQAGPADDELWAKARCKGEKILNAMILDDAGAGKIFVPERTTAHSDWHDILEDMKTWNYHDFGYSDDYCDFTSDDFSTPLKQLKLDYRFKYARRNSGTLLCYIIRHRNEQSDKRPIQDQTYEADGRTYPSTGGYFILAVDPKGAIYAISRMSPESAAKKYKREDLPKLRSSSEIMWGAWQGAGSGNKDIKYFFALYVVNQDTRGIILRALGNRKKTLALWPGIDFDMESDEGKALMGSPNGIGIGYLLIQRKPELGTKFISKVRIWKQEPFENFAHMLFYIEEWKIPEGGFAGAPRSLDQTSRGKEIE